MPPKVKSPEDRCKLKSLILDAARALFIERGFEAFSMREIARQVNYSATTLYHHFADKEALLQAVCDRDFLALALDIREIMLIPDLLERLSALCTAYAGFALAHPNHYRLMFMTPRPPCNLDLTEIEQGNTEQDAYAQLLTVVEDAFAAELFRSELQNSQEIAQTLWAGLHGVCSLEIALGNDPKMQWASIEARLALMQDALLRGLLRQSKELT